MTIDRQGRLAALLGPTNTGKTHYAIDRMLGYRSGMIGFPLRLLARENYDRVAMLKGRAAVALVTGEEKILPPTARYFLCTVESMPVDRAVEFLAVDEVQLCADHERGHVFTDRLLHARGLEETLFLGAETIRPLVRKLLPRAVIESRPRFSKLSYAGSKKLSRLPPRSAVVAFSAAQVYELAELMRRQRGGTAVVLGALSPRTRNAQVAMFEEGEVDYLVATDAIGMGLNLNLDHVAFSALSKFDGRGPRRLFPAEVAQIAGRAGRHMNDGTFGTTGRLAPFDEELVAAVEEHRFDPHAFVMWRNPKLDFRSPRALLKSLERHPPIPNLVRAREAEDQLALSVLAHDRAIAERATDRAAVALLWEICQVPDYRKMLTDQHLHLMKQLFDHLIGDAARLPEDWVAGQIGQIDRIDGDIDSLVARIAHVRTWTYITHRADWLDDSEHWQARTRAIEDKLSDALHAGLTQRFVDRRAANLVRRLRESGDLLGAVRANGDVLVEGEYVGRLTGFHFELDREAQGDDAKPLLTAARRALVHEIPRRLLELEAAPDKAFRLSDDGSLAWQGSAVASLGRGAQPLKPRVIVRPSEFLDGPQRERLRKRLAMWLEAHIAKLLPALVAEPDERLTGAARGLLFQLSESLGTLPRRRAKRQIASLSRRDRKILSDLGLRLGAQSLFYPALLRTRAGRLRALLWTVFHGGPAAPPLPRNGGAYRPQPPQDFEALASAHLAIGYRCFRRDGSCLALRADRLERIVAATRKLARQGPFAVSPGLCKTAGLEPEDLALLLPAIGFAVSSDGDRLTAVAQGGKAKGRDGSRRRGRNGRSEASGSPFAKLRDLKAH